MAKTIKKVTVKTTKQPKSITPPQKAVYANPSNYTKNGKRMISTSVNNVDDAESYDNTMNSVRDMMRGVKNKAKGRLK